MESGVTVQIPAGFVLIETAAVERIARQIQFKEIRQDFYLNSTLHTPLSTLNRFIFCG